ncbi:peptidylprolyl isomerase [Dermatophilus congolensis]|nr:peptidylprolyl isomerase [Dermatophilus congolensis]MBO3152912.1 peptidylprolyl isomerase [Dermatophilus congolensis]MBO3160075.1 peptidylprolyl isomerase [Dermatophilus congolensis]MBO3164200.1 peptidylprolyl isomerase [Dermatophilus congolensis]MBO3177745.1 peptidylprolyl isomerase [Dermatophilus congolensis]
MSTTALVVSLAALTLTACGSSSNNAGADSSSQSASASQPASAAPTGKVECPPADGAEKRTTQFSGPAPQCIDDKKTYTATVKTDVGEFDVLLDQKKAPKTVNNFVFLARNKYYDTTPFHRVIKDFMIQGGDHEGTGRGGPGYRIEDEFPQQGEYKVGSIAMANTGEPNSGGSQFFVVTGEAGVGLPPNYSLFGQVTKGMDVVKKIEADGGEAGDQAGVPSKVHKVEKVTITEK